MNETRVRFAILGFGHHAVRRLVPAFRTSQHALLAGMWRRDQAAAQANCVEYGIPLCFSTAEEMCASEDIDVIFITSPDALRRDDTLLAIRGGKAILCEKPLAMNAAEAMEMAAAAAKAGVLFGVGQNFRFNRSVEWVREKIAAGAIGEPQMAHAQFCYPAQFSSRKWIADPALACGGPMADVGVHCIDALRFVLGQEVVSVSALARKDAASGGVEAVASLQLEMSGSLFAHVSVSARAAYRTLLEVSGSDGVLIAENGFTVDRPVQAMLRRGGELVETVEMENGDGYTRMLDSFAEAYRGRGTFRAPGEDGVINMKALDAAYASWRTGLRVVL